MIKEIKFHGPQKAFFEVGPQPCLFLGGVAAGKSFVGILKMLVLLDQYPGSRGVVIRQRFQQLKKTITATLGKFLTGDHIARRNDNEGVIWLKNGSQLLLMHLDKPDSLDNMKSLEVNFAYVDQAEDISAEAFDILLERVGRWTDAIKRGGYPEKWEYVTETGEKIPPPYVMLSAYSPGYDHWLTARFWEHGAERERYRRQGYTYLVGSTRENPNVTRQYVQGRLAMGQEYVERFVDASTWGANEGRIFDISPQSVLDPDPTLLSKIKYGMRLFRVMDHGDASPTAVMWYATDSDENVFFFREYMKAGLLISEHRQNVYEMSRADGGGGDPPNYYGNYADPTIFAKSRGRSVNSPPQWSVRDEWLESRIVDRKTAVAWRAANNDEAMTINRVREYMREDPTHRNPITGELGAPRMYFVRRNASYPDGCHEVLADIRSAKRVVVGMNTDGSKQFGDERDETVRDHLLDCIRYSIGLRPSLAVLPKTVVVRPGEISIKEYNDLTAERDRMVDRDRRMRPTGDYGYDS